MNLKLKEYKMTKLRNKEYKIKYKDKNADFADASRHGVFITYVTGSFEKTVYFTQLEHEIQFIDLLKEAGYTYVQEETNINA